MKTRWFEGLTNEEDKDSIKYEFDKSVGARKRLKEILEKDIESLITSMVSEDHFDKDWAIIQADRVAQIKAYKKIIGLIE